MFENFLPDTFFFVENLVCEMCLIGCSYKKVFLNSIIVSINIVLYHTFTNCSEFLKALAHFPKQIIYGCDGKSNGIGVSFLPLFDVVFATESSSFQILATSTLLPECSYILSLFGNIKKAVVSPKIK
jgi:hypothetical protein